MTLMRRRFCVLNSVSKLQFREFRSFSVKTDNQRVKIAMRGNIIQFICYFIQRQVKLNMPLKLKI